MPIKSQKPLPREVYDSAVNGDVIMGWHYLGRERLVIAQVIAKVDYGLRCTNGINDIFIDTENCTRNLTKESFAAGFEDAMTIMGESDHEKAETEKATSGSETNDAREARDT